jgi:hypothetical protein
MCRLTYTQIRKMRDNADWARDRALELGLADLYLKYSKVSIRLTNCMSQFPTRNIERSYAQLAKGKQLIEKSLTLI